MSYSGLIAISLVASTLFIHHKALTSPTPPTATPRQYYGTLERIVFAQIWVPFTLQKVVVWLLGLVEITIILFRDIKPSSEYSQQILALLPSQHSHISHPILNPCFLTGTTLIIAGGVLRLFCYRALGRLFTFEVSVQKKHKLITNGPYRIVRHPSYAGMMMMSAGIFIWQIAPSSCIRQSEMLENVGVRFLVIAFTLWSLTLCYSSFPRARLEDAIMSNEFGDQWKRWAREVPYLLIPYIY
ncbi:hypothetical protein BDP27DRAFT_1321072 [Rhodocollybia butyracea]|uniref:Protein-S-isoprenylcysteine O-methyltransferase n=1 Tax=Rhodocollybia butyracea TaxID=206335 RepID=A0A9P5PZI0_9AGAR|nr:hypothetical protein BDP27DRAFT_1321072 [Rhodocollybia butyracea]